MDSSEFKPSGEGLIRFRFPPQREIFEEKPLEVEKTGLNLPFKTLNPIQTLFYRFYRGGNAVVSAPTSAGKTGVALIFFQNRNGRVVYTAPTKALVGEKAKELKKLFGEVDIRTGDVLEELKPVRSRVVVSTYENLALAIRNRSPWTGDIEAVVVDEVHAILGSRGHTVEELLTVLLGRGVDVLALSATVPGADRLARWLKAELFIESRWRPVPLKREIKPLKSFKEWIDPKTLESVSRDERIALKLLSALFEYKRPDEKVIVFVPKKSIGWKMLEFAHSERLEIANKTAPFEIEHGGTEIAFHNADVPKEEREFIEKEFKEGNLDILIATQTLAYGVNLPADRVLIGVIGFKDRKSGGFKTIPDPLDVLQEEGRAGRFGIKEIGYSHILPYGTSDQNLDRTLGEVLEGEFKPHLVKKIENTEGNFLDELSLFLLIAVLHRGGRFKEFLRESFSLSLYADHPAVDRALEWLKLHDYITGDLSPTDKGLFCLKSGVPPVKFEEFLRRKFLPLPLAVKLRPLLYTKRFDSLFQFVKGFEKFKEHLEEVESLLIPCGFECFKDNSEQFLFYLLGYTFRYPNLSNPPGEFSYLGTDALHLMRTLLELKKIGELSLSGEEILRIAHSVKYGLPEEFAPLGGLKGIGHIRANAVKEVLLINGIGKAFFSSANELLSVLETPEDDLLFVLTEIRGLSEPKAKREGKRILKLLENNRHSTLVDDRILYTLGVFLKGREALRMRRGELLRAVLEEL